MDTDDGFYLIDEISLETTKSGIELTVIMSNGDPVEISASEARRLAQVLSQHAHTFCDQATNSTLQKDEPIVADRVYAVNDATLWIDSGGGVTVKAVASDGAPVTLTPPEALRLAEVLIRLADTDDDL